MAFSGGVLFRFQRQPSLSGAEDIGQIFSGIYAVFLCSVDNRIGSSTGVGSFRRGGKQPVFPTDDKRFYRSFRLSYCLWESADLQEKNKDISSRFVYTEPLWQNRSPVSDLSFQAMSKNRQKPFLSVPAVVYIVLSRLAKRIPFQEQIVGSFKDCIRS